MKIKDLEIYPPLALAPMVGLSHSALRSLIVSLGGVGLLFTEMLSVKRLPSENENISPFLIRGEGEWPLFYQIFPSRNSYLQPAIEKIHGLGAQGIDINMGCPAAKVRRLGAGSALSEDVDNLKIILRQIRKLTDLPLSVKIRLGSDRGDRKYFLNFCKMLEDEGVDCLIVHARFNMEKFCRKPQWGWVADAKRDLNIPVIANGGILCVKDAEKCMELSGADGLMIGRGAVMKPWIFRDVARQLWGIEPEYKKNEISELYFLFADILEKRFRCERQLGRLKEFTHYFSSSYRFGHQLAADVQNSESMSEAKERAHSFFVKNENICM